MPLRNCRYWIFDMDGTLTLPAHDFDDIRRQIGLAEGVPILEAIAEMSPSDAAATHQKLYEVEMDIAGLSKPQPGAAKLLEKIIDHDGALGILTRNDETIAYETLKASGLDQYFNKATIVGRETCAPKPLPDGVEYLLSLWNIAANEAVMIGDYLYDIEAGKRAGTKTIHFDSAGLFSWPEFTDYRVTKIADIANLF